MIFNGSPDEVFDVFFYEMFGVMLAEAEEAFAGVEIFDFNEVVIFFVVVADVEVFAEGITARWRDRAHADVEIFEVEAEVAVVDEFCFVND